ncbi:hypothetical protein [Dyadobacter sp. BHUBP1]|uniref:hypothetical protein n=1 Tax=Dyadobacter sp. BHUBP1 TaxID=3424178 RepID=UPI003D356D2B
MSVLSVGLAQRPGREKTYVALLQKVLHEQQEWVKVHAAEYLLWAGYPEGVREVFLKEETRLGNRPQYRVGIWRVLHQASRGEADRQIWSGKIKEAFLDEQGRDRIHAAETLAKLHQSTLAEAPEITRRAISSNVPSLAIYALWSTAFHSEQERQKVKQELIGNLASPSGSHGPGKTIPAYALRQLGDLEADQWQLLARAALEEPDDSPTKVYLLSAAWVTSGGQPDVQVGQLRQLLMKYSTSPEKGARSEMAMALAERGDSAAVPVLTGMFENKHSLQDSAADYDVMAAAAYALIRICQREK